MSLRIQGWDIRRHQVPGVTPLEVWNLPVLGHELWELLGAPRVEADRRSGVPEAELGPRMVPALMEALELLIRRHGVDAVWLSGGLLCLADFRPSALPCPVFIAEEPRFAPVLAGLRMLAPLQPSNPVALDVGQTSLKRASPDALRVFERDTSALPLLFIGMPRPADGHHVRAAVRFIAGALGSCAPDALCLALPCPLDEALVPGGCTYGWEGHASLVADLLEAAGLPDTGGGTMLVLNDAELAAEAAREDARLSGARRVLCLTLGFGPGGALLERG